MSVLNSVPLINTILSGLSKAQLQTLRDCINGQGDAPIFRTCKALGTAKLTAADKGIKNIRLEIKDPLAAQQIYEGYLIYTDTGCWVISFANDGAQCLIILTIDPETLDVTIESNCCSVLELRSELDDALTAEGGDVTVTASDVDSGSATAGQVLKANGSGGAEWGDASGGEGALPLIDLRSIDTPTKQDLWDAMVALNNNEAPIAGTAYFLKFDGGVPMAPAPMNIMIQISYSGPSSIDPMGFKFCGLSNAGTTYGFVDPYKNATDSIQSMIKLSLNTLPNKNAIYDTGKILGVGSSGGWDLIEPASGGGTQLYKHVIDMDYTAAQASGTVTITIISTSPTQLYVADFGTTNMTEQDARSKIGEIITPDFAYVATELTIWTMQVLDFGGPSSYGIRIEGLRAADAIELSSSEITSFTDTVTAL